MSPSEKPILHLVVDPELLARVEDFRFTHRFQSRAAAVSWLLTWALDHGGNPTEDAKRVKQQRRKKKGAEESS